MQNCAQARLLSTNVSKIPRSGKYGRRRVVQGVSVALASVTVGGLMLYKGVRNLHEKLGVTSHLDAGEIEKKKHASYIYIPRTDLDQGRHDALHSPYDKSKTKTKPWFSWVQSHSHDPRTLLRLAQSDNHSVRLMGVEALAQQYHWHDAQYMMVAQACDWKTLVGLARSANVDPRFFLPPPPLPATKEVLEDALRCMLASLPTSGVDKCTSYFTSHALAEGKVRAEERGGLWCFGGNGLAFAESLSAVPEATVELFCLQALGKHSAVASHCKKIVREGGLQLLHRIYASRGSSIKVCRNIARILANTALDEELHSDLLNAGWVTILAEWLKSADLALSLLAAKALANLDRDYGELKLYEDGVHLYYPKHRYSEPVFVDVVFVHGLLGGPFRTWRQKDQPPTINSPQDKASKSENVGDIGPAYDSRSAGHGKVTMETGEEEYTQCWPKDWLAADFPHMRIITVEYDTHLSEWAPKCPFESENFPSIISFSRRLLVARSYDILRKLRTAGIGQRPVIWVGHSMGGLLVKNMLVMARDDPVSHSVVDQTKGMVFYSVPHKGSPLAARSAQAKYVLYPSVEVTELSPGSERLESLHKAFTELMFETGIPILSFGEGRKTDLPFNLKLMIVPPESSNPGFGEYHVMEDMNHLDICKPASRHASLYTLTQEFISSCVPHHLIDHILRANMPEEFILADMMN